MSLDIEKLKKIADNKWSDALKIHPELDGKIYSDFRDQTNRQVIDLVQEGGGVLGIGLVGYTYILEKAGLRISSYAGASAGAINATYLASISDEIYDTQNDSKSNRTLELLANTDMSEFIDGGRVIKFILKNSMNDYGMSKRFYVFFFLFILLFLAFNWLFFFLTTELNNILHISYPRILSWLSGTIGASLTVFLFYYVLKLILGKKMGLNDGDVFFRWIKNALNNASKSPLNLPDIEGTHLGNPSVIKNRRLILIAASLTSKKLVKFPEDAPNYFQDSNHTHPAEYVRASMSIPFFFNIFSPSNPVNVNNPEEFVDGGLLSNFPIRELNNKKLICPRFPTLGIKLGLENLNENEKKKSKGFIFHYVGNLLDTLRSFYDVEFQKENKEVEMLIGYIDTRDKAHYNKEINWLNFDLSDNAKEVLFTNGVDAAIEFLRKFDWEEYKNLRCKINA